MTVTRLDLPRPTRRTLLAAAGLGIGAGALAACGSSGDGGGDGPSIVTTCYAMDFLVERIAGDAVELISLATPGADAHGLEISVNQAMQIESADVVLQIPGFQLALDDAIASGDGENVLDISEAVDLLPTGDAHGDHEDGDEDDHDHEDDEGDGHDHGAFDPHFWHDPARMADAGDALAARLGDLHPERADDYTSAAEELRGELEELDAELAEEFGAAGGSRTFITSHAAYAYLADRYELHQVGIAGVDPEVEPSPRRLLDLEAVVEEEGVTTIFFETSASPRVAQTLADNVGVDSEELDNLETQLDPDQDYPAVMRENCRRLLESWS